MQPDFSREQALRIVGSFAAFPVPSTENLALQTRTFLDALDTRYSRGGDEQRLRVLAIEEVPFRDVVDLQSEYPLPPELLDPIPEQHAMHQDAGEV